MKIYVGLDGGGTQSRAQAQLTNGVRTGVLLGGPANVFSDPHGAKQEITKLLEKTLAAVQALAPETDPKDAAIVLGLAGAQEAGSRAQQKLSSALPYPKLRIMSDVDITVAGALTDGEGIVAGIGTGSFVARQTDGKIRRLGGYGFTLGDEGSGAWIGKRALKTALHAHDGLIERAPLSDDIWRRYESVSDLLGFVKTALPADVAALAPLVLHHDAQGCSQARSIMDEACGYLHQAIRTLQGTRHDLPVIAMGGLGNAVMDRLSARCHPVLVRNDPIGSALDGALWTARKHEGHPR